VQTLTIDRIAAGGDGVARADGMAVFVPRTAPGDVAQVAYVSYARHGRGRVLQILAPSAHRVEPPCVHYERDRCGGCQLQHLDADTQQQARQQIVQETLRRIGRREITLPPLDTGEAWGYRSRLTLTLRRSGSRWIGGLHAHDDPSRVFALETCLIAHPALVAVWGSIRSVLRSGAVSLPVVADERGGPASLRLSLRLEGEVGAGGAADASDPSVQVVLEGGRDWPQQEEWTDAIKRTDARVRGVWWTPAPTVAAATAARSDQGAPVADYLPQAREALAFAQVNAGIASRLRQMVFDAVLQFSPTRVLDGYAGTGMLSERLAQVGVPVVAVEADTAGAESAVARLAQAGEAGGRSRVVCDLMERAVVSLDVATDVVVLNPPRRGVHVDVTGWLEAPAQRHVRGVVYVSCDPATLARDLARLPSWRVERVHCFDMFPQTAHVETVCVLHRESA
jgi:23S rRNA (uracil1939-C5)-methyltransferase